MREGVLSIFSSGKIQRASELDKMLLAAVETEPEGGGDTVFVFEFDAASVKVVVGAAAAAAAAATAVVVVVLVVEDLVDEATACNVFVFIVFIVL
jgi:hypothetical protein